MQSILIKVLTGWLIFFPLSLQAEVYKWVDEHGRTHYGEKPPAADAAAEVVIKKPSQSVPNEIKTQEQINEETERLLKVMEEERNQKKEEKQKQEKEMAERKEKCTQLENDLRDTKQGGTVYYDLDKDGERQYISDEELKKRINEMEKTYKKEC